MDKTIDLTDECVPIHLKNGYLSFERDLDRLAADPVPELTNAAGEQTIMEAKKGEYELEDFGDVQRCRTCILGAFGEPARRRPFHVCEHGVDTSREWE